MLIMLDERTVCLLKIINEKCKEGCFKVISVDELVLEFPKRFSADGDLIRQMITALNTSGYLTLRYDRDSEFCLAPTPKGREFYETKQFEPIKTKRVNRFWNYFFNSLGVFFGVFFAVLLLWLLGVIC